MKISQFNRWSGAAFAAILTAGFSLEAQAIPLSFEQPPLAPAPYTQGQTSWKFVDLDMGTVYNVGPGSYGNPGNVAAGVAALDATPHTQATGALPGSAFGDTLDDSWGIASVTQIFGTSISSTNPIFTPGGKGFELNAVFYGAQDFATTIDANGQQTTQSVGLRIDIYRNPLGTFDSVDQLGSAGRGALQNQYAGISAGVLELSLVSTAGGLASNPLTEFQTIFTPGFGGTGSAYANVIGGASAAQFDTNSINLFHGGTADFSLNFTTRGPLDSTNSIPAGSDWLVSSNDPFIGAVIPEPGSVFAGLACLLPIFGTVFGRRRRS